MIAGATPKETTSASESNSMPKLEWPRVARAILPSNISQTAAMMISQAAKTKRSCMEETIAQKPRNKFKIVTRFGATSCLRIMFEFSYYTLSRLDLFAQADFDFHAAWKKNFHARAEFYHAEAFATPDPMPFTYLAHDPPCQNAGNLLEQNLPFRSFEADDGLLVFRGSCRQRSDEKTAALVAKEFDLAIIRHAIHMHVERREKDGDTPGLGFDKFSLFHFIDPNNRSVGGRYDQTETRRRFALGIAEKKYRKSRQQPEYHAEYPQDQRDGVALLPIAQISQRQQQGRHRQDAHHPITLTMHGNQTFSPSISINTRRRTS